MKKRFNDTGLCIAGKHYMADTSAKLAALMELVEEGAYFTINRPRQYGKTTSMHELFLALNKRSDYLDSYSLKEGFLLIFDFRKEKEYKEELIRFGDKDIFAVWV